MLKKFLNKLQTNTFLFIILIVVLFIYAYNAFILDTNLDSLCDEGYLYLMIHAARNGIYDGFSQWPTIIDCLFGNTIASNILFLRYTRFIVHLISITFFCLTTSFYLSKKGFLNTAKKKYFYIFTIYLLGSLNIGSIAIAYNTLQEFFLLIVIGLYLISTVTGSKIAKLLYFFIGFMSFYSILNILPSAILVLLSIVLLTFYKNAYQFKSSIISVFWIFIGMLIAALIFNFFFLNLEIVFDNMITTFNNVKKWRAGYDTKSFLINIFIYFRDLFMGLSLLFGTVVFSYFVYKFLGKWFGFIVLVFSMILFSIYQIKPQFTLSTLLAFPLVLLLMMKLMTTNEYNFKRLFSYNFLFYLFLFFLPLLSTIGTNLYLGSKIIMFILPWGVLFVELFEDVEINVHFKSEMKFVRLIFFGILFLYPIVGIVSSTYNSPKQVFLFEKSSAISDIKLTKQQFSYFNNVDSILKLYGYKPKEYFFSTQLDHMTMVAFDATPHGIYFFPTMFLIDPNKKKERKPDFLFLNDYDLKIMGDTIKSLGWGFPEAYDSIYVGTPEIQKMSYSTERTLYCLKTRKLKL